MISQQLLTFMAVAKNGSFSKTAEAMYISPTAVMKQIDNLEERIGVTLFERTNHGLNLTDAGKSILNDAKYLVDYVARAEEKARDINEKQNEHPIRIGTSLMTPAKFILDIWNEIQELAPNLKVELIPFENTPENAKEILSNLGGQIDVVAGIYDSVFARERGFQTILLEEKEISFAIPISSHLASKQSLSLDDLKEIDVMFIKKGWNCYVDELRKMCEEKDITVVDFSFFNLAAFNDAVKRNMAIISINGWENVHPLLKIVPSQIKVKVPYGIMYSLNPSKQVKQFIKAVKTIINN